jgi:hypothetical protein
MISDDKVHVCRKERVVVKHSSQVQGQFQVTFGVMDRGPGRKRVGGPKKRKVCKDDWKWNMGKVPRGQQQPQH